MNQENIVMKKTSLLSKMLSFFIVFIIGAIVESIIQIISVIIYLLPKMSMDEINKILNDSEQLTNYIYGNNILTLISLFSTIAFIVVTIIWCIKVEKHTLDYMGFKKKNILKNYCIGLIIGYIMFSLVVIFEMITGSLKFNGFNNFNFMSVILLILFFVGFIIQSASEEILTRGYLLNNIKSQHKVVTAIIVSSFVFGILHIFNDGFSIIPLINISLVGIFFGLYYLCFNNIWGVCAVHGMWNFAQGNIYGIKVSGTNVGESIINTTQVARKELLNGGSFGAEGGLITTFVLIISIILLYYYMTKKKKLIIQDLK